MTTAGNGDKRPKFRSPSEIRLDILIRELRDKSVKRTTLLKMATRSEVYDKKGSTIISIPFTDYQRVRPSVNKEIQKLQQFASVKNNHEKQLLFVRLYMPLPSDIFSATVMDWANSNSVFPTDKRNLLSQFFFEGAGIAEVEGHIYKTFVINKLSLVNLTEDYTSLVFTLESEHNDQVALSDLVSNVGPRATLVAVAYFPTAGAVVAALVVQSLVGLAQFFLFMADAEEDGIITEQESADAWWELIGVAPFAIVGYALMGKEIIGLGVVIFERLISALSKLPELLESWTVATDEGWNSFGKFDPDSSIFVPTYAVSDLGLSAEG